MARDIDDDYFYDTGTLNEELDNFQLYEKNGELHVRDLRTDDVTKVKANGEIAGSSLTTDEKVNINKPSGATDDNAYLNIYEGDETADKELIRLLRGSVSQDDNNRIDTVIDGDGHFYTGRAMSIVAPADLPDPSFNPSTFSLFVRSDLASGNPSVVVEQSSAQNETDNALQVQDDSETVQGTIDYGGHVDFPTFAGDYHFAGSMSGGDPDARLDSAETEASDGDVIYLEGGTYDSARTLNQRNQYIGTLSSFDNNGTVVDAKWTVKGSSYVEGVWIGSSGELEVTGANTVIDHVHNGPIDVNDNKCTITRARNCTIDFASSTVGGLVESSPESAITDNGNNAVHGKVTGSYTGDGTTDQSINFGLGPSKVLVEGSDGTLYETRDDGLSVIDGSDPAGKLTIEDGGFSVGDNSGDADPNTNGESYSFVAYL